MRLALRELRRQPGRFVVAMGILSVLAVLLMFLGGLLDGLLASSTGAYRAQQADLIVYSAEADESLIRSRIERTTRDAVAATDGVADVGALASLQLAGRPGDRPDTRDLVGVTLFGYELAPRGVPDAPPADGEVVADDSLRSDGFDAGDTVLLGPARTPVTIIGFTSDTEYSGQASLWGSLATWAQATAANRPDRATATGTVPALVVRVADGEDSTAVADAIDEATGATATLTIAEATEALPGVSQQRSTFNQIIGVTAIVAVLVVSLFFALITAERLALYGILKAVGASSATLFAGVLAQAAVITLTASAIGAVLATILDLVIPPGALPFELTVGRVAISVALMLAAAAFGSAFSLRRVLRVDPASAIGAGV